MFRKLKLKTLIISICKYSQQRVAKPLRSKKARSTKDTLQSFIDLKQLRAVGGSGGNGCLSFLSAFRNEFAGPDGGDGGNGGDVIFEANSSIKDLNHIPTIIKAADGEKGYNKDCHGKNAKHEIIKVPIGTMIRNEQGNLVGDLNDEGAVFVAARGGTGGKGNHFFATATLQAPKIAEPGEKGEDYLYIVEIKSMAQFGLIGFPNAGKSTLLRAISRARPKIAPYPFTTLKPYVGIVQYDDYEQIAVADLPGLIPDSHKNRGLGIQFLRHVERCMALVYIVDVSHPSPWEHLQTLMYELEQYNEELMKKPQLIVANKMDCPEAEENFRVLREHTELPIIPISAKLGKNISELLKHFRIIYDKQKVDK